MNTQTSTPTTSQIRRLRTEAAIAGDSLMVEICDLALGADSADEPDRAQCEAARAECARVIDAARAMID